MIASRAWKWVLAGAALLPVVPAAAVTVDGQLDAAYGPAAGAQAVQTSFVDANPALSPNAVLYADGSELDAAYGVIAGGVLYLFLAGNQGFCCASSFSHQEEFDVFIDSKPGGQHTLRADNPNVGWRSWSGLDTMAGLTFDAGVEPDYWLGSSVNMTCRYAELLTGGGGAGVDLGYNTAGAPGTLTGGANPYGILAAVDNSNGSGVGAGCGGASGAGVATGVEWAIPLAAIGDPSGCVTVTVFTSNVEGHALGNQVLGTLPPGTCALGAPAGVDFSSIAGAQFFTVCPAVTPAARASWGRVKIRYR